MVVRKTMIAIDDELIARADEILDTRGIESTVDGALMEVVRMDARRRFLDKLKTMDGLELDSERVMSEAWR